MRQMLRRLSLGFAIAVAIFMQSACGRTTDDVTSTIDSGQTKVATKNTGTPVSDRHESLDGRGDDGLSAD